MPAVRLRPRALSCLQHGHTAFFVACHFLVNGYLTRGRGAVMLTCMSTSTTPPPCDPEIFANGKALVAIHASSRAAEAWVKKIAARSGQRIDWHFSGGVANVLMLGEYAAAMAAVDALEGELDGRILRRFGDGEHGPYRAGDPLPEGVIGVDTLTGLVIKRAGDE